MGWSAFEMIHRFIQNRRNYRGILFSRFRFKDSLLDCESPDLVLVDLETLLGTGKQQYSRLNGL